MIVALLVTMVFIIAGMAPTLISYFIIRRPGNKGSTCIMLFNIAGMLPVLDLIWSNVGDSGGQLVNVFAWYTIYMSAGVGVGVVWLGTYIAYFFLRIFSGQQRTSIKARQEELYKEWGSAVLDD